MGKPSLYLLVFRLLLFTILFCIFTTIARRRVVWRRWTTKICHEPNGKYTIHHNKRYVLLIFPFRHYSRKPDPPKEREKKNRYCNVLSVYERKVEG